MAQTKHEIQQILNELGVHPRHQFGQNFMIDQNLVRLITDAGMIDANDLIIEIGPGTGTLTEELLSRGANVVAVEIDRNLAARLRDQFANNDRFNLIEGDALQTKHSLNPALLSAIRQAKSPGKLVANLPYNIASPLIIELLIAGVETLVFTVQREVADRLRARAGEEAFGAISVMCQLLAEVEILRTLPPQAFWPMPEIESSLVRLNRRDQLGNRAADFGLFVQKLFSTRRKTLRKSLALLNYDADRVIEKLSNARIRAEELTPQQIFQVFQMVG